MYPREPLDDDAVVVLEVPDLILMIIGGPPVVQVVGVGVGVDVDAVFVCFLLLLLCRLCEMLPFVCLGNLGKVGKNCNQVRKFQ